MAGRKILWLCSWYPNKTDPFDGDFIQRLARAISIYDTITVIRVVGDTSGHTTDIQEEIRQEANLTEHIIYFRKKTSWLGRWEAYRKMIRLYKKAVLHYFSTVCNPELVHVQVPMPAGMVALWIKRKFKIPFVISEHWGIYNPVEKLNYSTRSIRFKNITKKIFSEASGFISVSRFLAEGVNNLVLKKDYTVIPNVADTNSFFYKEKPPGTFRFIHVSNMAALKNVNGILHAFKQFISMGGNAELVVVGNKDDALKEMADSLGLSQNKILFKGEVAYETVANEMQASDCLVLFSDIENSPCVIGEALCCGLPVIASQTGGIPELLGGSNSLLVNARDEQGLAQAMKNMVENYSRIDRRTIAATASQKFGYSAVGKLTDEVYNSCLSIASLRYPGK